MNVRELLQKEIWSKGTTRKIWLVLAVVVVGIFLWRTVESHWLTPFEQKKARIALIEVDALQNFSSMSEAQYQIQMQKAEKEVRSADRAAWTYRDQTVAQCLSSYLTATEMSHDDMQRIEKYPTYAERHPEETQEMKHMSEITQKFLGDTLHVALKQ